MAWRRWRNGGSLPPSPATATSASACLPRPLPACTALLPLQHTYYLLPLTVGRSNDEIGDVANRLKSVTYERGVAASAVMW